IRNVLARQQGGCKVTAIFTLPLGPALATRLSSASGMKVSSVPPRRFRVHSPGQRVFATLETNFLPGTSSSLAVVLSVRNWRTGIPEDWMAYEVLPRYSAIFEDLTRLGRQMANWV